MSKKNMFNRLRKLWTGRFAFLRWPLEILKERVASVRENGPFSRRAGGTFYPIRAVRYWWVLCALIDEGRRRKRRIRVADVGCSKGFLKDFMGEKLDAEWVGLDMNIDGEVLEKSGYEEAYECDFDKRLPLPDNSVDAVVFLHVIEHLPRPLFTMTELSRILRPGGLLLAGSPVAPRPIAWMREQQLKARIRKGKVQPGGHVNSLSCSKWRTLVKQTRLNLRMLTGTFLVRWSGSPLENKSWWLRLNQLWGALFPSLGGEAYLIARKPPTPNSKVFHPAAGCVFVPWKWKKGLVVAFILVIVFSWSFFLSTHWNRNCPVTAVVARHQDGNDVFYTIKHPAMKQAVKNKIVTDLYEPQDVVQTYEEDRRHGKDPNYFIPLDLLDAFSQVTVGLDLNVVEDVDLGTVKFALLNSEGLGEF
ncbi:MAG TPA: class I SAM-dependent methyltransferase [Desulfobacteraceae bacterium]|nr:class I SAM-dependent methyltransferase [Desulfobacteraceae bacterium]